MKDKSLLNVAGIIALVFGIIFCLPVVTAFVGVPCIIGANKLREFSRMSDEEIMAKKDTLLIWTVVFLFICQISGILAIIYYVGLEQSSNKKEDNVIKSDGDKFDSLERLNNLYKEKVLTKEEFEKEKARILNR